MPMADSASATTTSWPSRAAARATAKPTTPAPITKTCMRFPVSWEERTTRKRNHDRSSTRLIWRGNVPGWGIHGGRLADAFFGSFCQNAIWLSSTDGLKC